jgi:murein DD-endopeptidase MepM/ murein hydrolase activator NlpD
MAITPTGFTYPLSTATPKDTNWLERAPSYPEAGKIHFGSDLAARNGTRVLAVADGTVIGRQSDGAGNQVLFIQHQSNQGAFVGIYAHVRNALPSGTRVLSAQRVAEVADYGTPGPSKDHLHWGVRPGTAIPPSQTDVFGWGRANISWYEANGTNGMEAPINYITANRPATSTSATIPTLTSTRAAPGEVLLSWQINNNVTISLWELEYRPTPSSQPVRFATLIPSETSRYVRASIGSTFEIRVVAIGTNGQRYESAFRDVFFGA